MEIRQVMSRNVYITGVGVVTPLNPFSGVKEFWSALCSGKNAIRRMKLPLLKSDREWLMAGFDNSSLPEKLPVEDKFGYIAEEALRMAVLDARLDGIDNREETKTGIFIGTVLGNILCKEKRLMEGGNRSADNIKEESLSYMASHIASRYGLTGPVFTVSTACASGTDAVGIAARQIKAGNADIMIAGGVETLSDLAISGFNSLQAITEDRVRPFDRRRSGLAPGEGAAFVVLESGESASKRGVEVYGRVLGYSSRSDANHLTGPHREGRGLAGAIRQALSEAQIHHGEIDYINAHGTGTVYNDLMETKAMKGAFGEGAYGIPVSSTKSMLGHSFGAAGSIEVVCCLLSIKTGRIHPTLNLEEKDPECDLDYVPAKARNHVVNTAMSLSAGFGGQNSVIILGGV